MTIRTFNQLPDASATQSPLNECDGVLWVISPQASINQCTNPSYETNTNNWIEEATTTIARVAEPWDGAYSLSWITTSGKYLTYGDTVPFTLAGYGNYAISFYCYSDDANIASRITVELVNVATSVVTVKLTTQITTEWRRVVLNAYISPAVAAAHKLRVSVNQSLEVIIDAVQIEQVVENGVTILGTVNHGATTYFDGSTVGTVSNAQVASPQYAWQGKVHESVSSRSVGAANGGALINLQNALGFTIIGILGADNPTTNNQMVNFNGIDGASLVDIITPARQITIVGRISATTKTMLSHKISTFLEYFGRDTTAIRQPKYFVFQYKNGRDLVGQPLYFSGVITGTANAPVSNDLAYTISLSLMMLDPFFYGHTESFSLPLSNLQTVDSSFSFVPDFTKTSSTVFSKIAQSLANANGSIRAMAVAPNGDIFIGGDFAGFDIYPLTENIVKYSPITNSFSALTGGIQLTGRVSALAITPDGQDLWIGGAFTDAGLIDANRIVRYTIGTGTYADFGAGVGGGVSSGEVLAITIDPVRRATSAGGYPYDVYIGGTFTATAGGVTVNRIAKTSNTNDLWNQIGTGNGMNGSVLSLAYNNNLARLYVGGSFTTSQGGTANSFTGICYIDRIALGTTVAFYSGVNVAAGGFVNAIYSRDVDNSLYIGGSFTATFAGAALLRAASFNGVVWNQLDYGLSDGIVENFQQYNNGIILSGTFTSGGGYSGLFNGLAFYNGQTLAPVPVSSLGKGFSSTVVTPDNALYLGVLESTNSTIASGQISKYIYKGTAAAAITWQINHDNEFLYDLVLNQIGNLTQQTTISFKQLPITYKEFVQINTGTGVVTSDIFGNQLRYILGAGLTSQRIQPGNNYLYYWYVTPQDEIFVDVAAFWRQTYNNLFDGVRAT